MDFWGIQKAKIVHKQLSQAGFTITRHDSSIRCSPQPTADVIDLIRSHKSYLLEMLASADAPSPTTTGDTDPGARGASDPTSGGDQATNNADPSTDLVVWMQYECQDGESRFMLKDDFDELSNHIGAWSSMFGKHSPKRRGRIRPLAIPVNQTPKSWDE